MPLMGSHYTPAKIYNIASGHYDTIEPYMGQYSGLLYDDPERMKTKIRDAPFAFDFEMTNNDKAVKENYLNRLKHRNNKTLYEMKKGRRVENLSYVSARDKPFININDVPSNFEMPERIQQMKPNEQKHLARSIVSKDESGLDGEPTLITGQQLLLNKAQDPYEIDELNFIEPLDFIVEGKGKYMAEMSNNNAIDSTGSTIKQNYAVEMNRPVVPKSGYELYKMYMGKNMISNINNRQINNLKSKQILGLYGGKPAEARRI